LNRSGCEILFSWRLQRDQPAQRDRPPSCAPFGPFRQGGRLPRSLQFRHEAQRFRLSEPTDHPVSHVSEVLRQALVRQPEPVEWDEIAAEAAALQAKLTEKDPPGAVAH
jgi:hypothetical protein